MANGLSEGQIAHDKLTVASLDGTASDINRHRQWRRCHASRSSLVGAPDDAAGLNGVVVDGITYDVTFIHSSYAGFYGYVGSVPIFNGNSGLAADAAYALADAMNEVGITRLNNTGGSAYLAPIPFDFNGEFYLVKPVVQIPVFDMNWHYSGDCYFLTDFDHPNVDIADSQKKLSELSNS